MNVLKYGIGAVVTISHYNKVQLKFSRINMVDG